MSGVEERKGFLLLLFLGALLFPYRVEYDWFFFSTLSVLDVLLVILLPVVLMRSLVTGRLALADRRVFFVLLMPVVFAVASILWTVDVLATLKSIVVYGSALAAFLLVAEFGKSLSLSRLTFILVGVALGLVVVSALSYLPGSIFHPSDTMPASQIEQSGFLYSYHARLSHPFLGLSNSFATVLAMLLPLVLFSREVGLWRFASWWAAILLLAATLATGSRGVLLALGTVYVVFSGWRLLVAGKLSGKGIGFIAVASMFAVLFVLMNPDAQEHLADRFRVDNLLSRLEAVSAVFTVLENTPVGIGSGVALSGTTNLDLTHVHNAYVQNFLWFGYIGGSLLNLMLLALPVAVVFIPVRSGYGKAARRALALSISILLLINLSQASWEGSLLRVWIYVLIGLGLVMVREADRYGWEQGHE